MLTPPAGCTDQGAGLQAFPLWAILQGRGKSALYCSQKKQQNKLLKHKTCWQTCPFWVTITGVHHAASVVHGGHISVTSCHQSTLHSGANGVHPHSCFVRLVAYPETLNKLTTTFSGSIINKSSWLFNTRYMSVRGGGGPRTIPITK